MDRTIHFGPPGTGKTHMLLGEMQRQLEAKVPVERIAFLTFTRRARLEAVERVEKTLGMQPKDLPYFRTIHSMAFRALKLQDGDVMGRQQLREFGATMGLEFGENMASDQAAEGITSAEKGDHLLAIDNLARLKGKSAEHIWREVQSPYTWSVVDQFIKSYHLYKQERALLDFTDVLEQFVKSGIKLPVAVSFIDEAQDLAPLQWLAALQSVEESTVQHIAGDDDQAIYRWAGAEVEVFQDLPGVRHVLDHSYRLPRTIHGLAMRILQRIKHRVPKQFNPRDADGIIYKHTSSDSLIIRPGEQWLWLVRNRYLIGELRAQLEQLGIAYQCHGSSSISDSDREAIYAWERLRTGKTVTAVQARDMYKHLRSKTQVRHGHKLIPGVFDDAQLTMMELRGLHGLLVQQDAPWYEVLEGIPVAKKSYYRHLLRTHKTLRLVPQVTLETVHGAKGAQCDNVALFTEQARRTYEESNRNPDDEHRVWYVGATRARCALHVVQAASPFSYQLPRA